ncbi:heme ABC transporter ATP-binding protein/permease CydC [Vibrio natriegens]|uniref:Glutathione/L-cysteine transport system ATP-binding/permease protein CydC n=1 Tax=Vibrio natriegens NBRC 15636 = ATCC 14048 = DSM 759 TaxID=1219067 RepID=A0AAN0Y286_VIBNA|nr:cysteine/glutathione ABC transporter ATP-binding protein/permease CydC [Vibrio natriegens]ALR15809.1 amino acid ABC transporter permease [Vibrio natriegens NBRC 15636 = ATCC 14048 = DSM 759]ANQ12332.1 cysteine/glutathione ABC transporter ATP-binding protein/permease CydC [Vibrio natriegens NBRC 15636 = ATCC 14048 = DSM 759]EPM42820.1 glutathione ABC transporter ATP-binding protein [Vibrio natriegens NBRC 15636 = ATCC 14048 = DSM 759]MDX6026710.1 cysteine/glutathione ABC transporter ATP-bindi
MRDLLPYLKLYKKHWFGLSLGMLLAFLTLAASIGLLTLSGWFISAASVAGLTIARETFNYMLPGAGVRGAAMARTAGRWGERVVSHNATFKLLTDLRIFFFEKLSPLIPGRVSTMRDADVLNRLVADVDAMDHVYLRLISPVIIGIFGILSLTAVLAFFDWHLAMLLGSVLTVMLLVWPVLFYKLGKKNGAHLTHRKAELRVATLDWLQGYSELSIFGAEERYRNLILDKQKQLLSNQFVNANLTGMASGLLMLANGLTLVMMLWFAADGVGGRAPDPWIALFAFATMASFEILMPIAGAFQYLGQTLTSARRLNEVILAKPDVVFPQQSSREDKPLDIEFKNISFAYPDGQQKVLNDLSLSLPLGSKTAVVGQTGSGKSTLIQLLCRYWDVNQGEVRIGGASLKDWGESDLRSAITVVSQRVDVLNGTLRDNLLMAAPDATDEQLADILTQVDLGGLLEEPGLSAWLGDGGRQLSGGEKRRIGIARALLRDAPILLLDEPTEGLDKRTEQKVMALFNQHFANKTVVFITHRLIELENMDNICLMEQGEIIEQGNHNALIAQQGRYFQLLQSL